MNQERIKQQIKLFGDIPTEIQPLEGADSNFVFQVDKDYVYKWFPLRGQMLREIAGIFLFGNLSNFAAPLLIDKGDRFILSEFLSGFRTAFSLLKDELVSEEIVEQKVADFLAEVFSKYQQNLTGRINLYPFLSWKKRLDVVIAELENNPELRKSLGDFDIDGLVESLNILKITYISPRKNTLLHRDLHLENLLFSKDEEMAVIDFEHCMDGPIELEFANSLFWDDDKSLKVNKIVSKLRSKGIDYDEQLASQLVDFYFADQLVLAISRNEFTKIPVLVDKYKDFRNNRRYQYFLV